MVFISDGVPTFFVDDNEQRGGWGDVERWAGPSKEPTRKRINKFITEHKDVMIHTVGVSRDINGATPTSDPELLKYMAQKSGGQYIGVYNNANLYEEVKKLLEANMVNVLNITDELSDSVEFFNVQPDIRVSS